MMAPLWVGLGGGLGSVLRYGVGKWISSRLGAGFPWGTLCVNVLGCLAIGFLQRWLESRGAPESLRLFMSVGLLGGFTTFSAFGNETVSLLQSERFGPALLYVMASLVAGLTAVWMGNRLS
ncbi:MAG: fluoride efflux transporter CrcB [Planctomycetota bacterium]